MLPFKRTFENEKHQLQELNSRLSQYLSRTKQLEQENAHLITEINKLRQTKTAEWEPKYKAEIRDMRRMVGQLSLEKSQAEMEREKLWRELQMVQSLCSEQTGVCRDISGELKGCEKELHHAHKTNSELEQRLFQLEAEYKCLEDAHRQEIDHFRRQVEARVVPIITQTYRGPPVASMEEVQEYARGMSEGWIETFEMYQRKVEEMELSIKADQAMLSELQREKMLYASELDKLRTEAEKQGHIQMRLEEQLMHMQEKFRVDFGEYQMIIEQLEHERNKMADTIAEKMREHQHLLQVKMDLGMEVAAYRALLEGERVGLQDAHRRVNQHQRERIIDIKMPAKPYTPRASTLTTRQHMDIRYTPPTSSLRRSPVPPSGSISPSRVIPISVAGRARYQSPESRRDMISFAKARAATSAPATTTATAAAKDKQTGQRETHASEVVRKTTVEEKTVKIKQVSQVENKISPIMSSTAETKSVRVVSPPMMSLSAKMETESKKLLSDETEVDNLYDSEFKDKGRTESTVGPSEKKILDSVSVEEIIEKVMKPAGLEAKVCSSGESKVRYHVEKTQQDDGTTKTQIVLESKVEEELDISEDFALDELLSQGVKKVSLQDIKDTATGSMIKNLLSDLQGAENLQNRSVNVEIIEEPVDSFSDEELEVEQKSRSTFYEPSSTYFQIEELENVPHDTHVQRSDDDAMKSSMTGTDYSKGRSVHVEEVSRQNESSYFSREQEPHEYYVSTPDDNLSEAEEGGGITSYGHYGVLDDLSDERYYQDESLPLKSVIVEESDEYKFMADDHSFVKESFPDCILEEEVRVSPVVQESVLEFLREDSLEPKEQLKGALEQLQSSVSGPLREELAFLSKVSSESPQNVAVDVKKVQQSNDNGTMTIVAELNVSQTLEDSGLLEAEDDLSEEQIMAALRSSNLGLEKTFQGGAGGGYSFRVTKEEDVAHGEEIEGFTHLRESVSEITEKHIKLGPSEKSFTFQMDVQSSHSEASPEQELQSQTPEAPVKISQEKKVATIYLESPTDD
ncbi:synemin-like [Seriola lalandi dorsalis]|uniref:Synemin, intermediate filament protein n=1 Tax=Seriola lalandi dorsalis TaxID=1841481 RepID=A0A3B4XRW7_SERLL|nr:synemin-like [Seriola lalandi dorsalis]